MSTKFVTNLTLSNKDLVKKRAKTIEEDLYEELETLPVNYPPMPNSIQEVKPSILNKKLFFLLK